MLSPTTTTTGSDTLTLSRGAALQLLQKAVEEFVRHVGQVKRLAPSVIDNAGGRICTFGSYRLGVYGPGMCSVFCDRTRVPTNAPPLEQAPISILSLSHPSTSTARTSLLTSLAFSSALLPRALSRSTRLSPMPSLRSSRWTFWASTLT